MTPTATPTTSPASTAATTPATATVAATAAALAAPLPCQPTQLAVAAVTGASSYAVGAEPIVMMQVTDSGAAPCVQDLADTQVELRVYNGESRVWGSHDCQIEPGVLNSTLQPHQPVRVSVTWSGLSSQPGCAGTRQRVGAGTYTLYALLAGRLGTAAQFSIS